MSSPASPEGPDDRDATAGTATDGTVTDRDAADLRAARRVLTLFVVAAATAAGGAIALFTGLIGEDSGDTTVSAPDSGEVDAIGPADGDDVAPYVDARRERLGEVEGRRVAVVSFASYLREREADDLLGDGIDLVSLLVAFPADEPRVTEEVGEARSVAATDAESQLEEISQLVNTVEDPEFAEFYRAELIRYRKVLAEIDHDEVVFGAVVTGRAGDLRALGSRTGVRLVDVGDGVALSDDARITGLRPEESITVGEPAFRP